MLVEKLAGWRGVLALSLAALIAGLLVLAMPGVADAKKQKVDSAKGKGVDFNGGEFKFSAKNLPNTAADKAKGKLNYKNEAGSIKAEVQCLRVDEVSAHLVAEVEKSSLVEAPEGTLVGVDVFDSGEPKGEGDQFQISPSESDECREPMEAPEIEKGNITVKEPPILE